MRRTLTASAAGGWAPLAAGTLLVALAGDAVLVALAVLWPVLALGAAAAALAWSIDRRR